MSAWCAAGFNSLGFDNLLVLSELTKLERSFSSTSKVAVIA